MDFKRPCIIDHMQFDSEVLRLTDDVTQQLNSKYGLQCSPNLAPLVFAIYNTSRSKFDIAQCGVYEGATLLGIAETCRFLGLDAHIYGFDSFDGFPKNIDCDYDKPMYFKTLMSEGKIDKAHYDQAFIRTSAFTNDSHLDKTYFSIDKEKLLQRVATYNNITLIDGDFDRTLSAFRESIDLLHLDCDLYMSYCTSLTNLYPLLSSQGRVVFDEYYSLKYPGAREAVNRFFKERSSEGVFLRFRHGDFERWLLKKH